MRLIPGATHAKIKAFTFFHRRVQPQRESGVSGRVLKDDYLAEGRPGEWRGARGPTHLWRLARIDPRSTNYSSVWLVSALDDPTTPARTLMIFLRFRIMDLKHCMLAQSEVNAVDSSRPRGARPGPAG
ncbi:hypothetical protein EVAR_30061_1 [Eumeta japonica]|uniref:Uncharacterized protein n=1 Tax=Eumeta variegata TaxID=151549 RepID=A0A4C1XA61_EUMVA|nr:hypothetical protein EVAR_30061_1 [Eumeta japonica]